MVPQEKAPIIEFYGRADTWGAVMRTIKASSGSFTSMTTTGHRIAAACDDGTVGIYDSITGALRLSLSPADPVLTIKGTMDGSTLLCTHRKPSITAWDIQTGGLVHTLTLDGEVRGVAICLEGRHVACALSGGSIKILEVSGKTGSVTFGSGSPVTHLCWLESGKQLVTTKEASVQVWNVVSRQVICSFITRGLVYDAIYSQKLNKFATVAASGGESIVTVVDSLTGTSFTDRSSQRISCVTFSQITKQLVCGMNTPGIELFSITTRDWKRFNYPATITSISTLASGTVVANVRGSGIQLLSLDEGYTPSQQQTLSALTVCALDRGNIIAVSSTNPNQVELLESPTMSPLLTIPVPPAEDIPIGRPTILCASLQHRVAVHLTENTPNIRLELWRFEEEDPEWVDTISGCRVVGGLSPSGSRLVVLHGVNGTIHVRIWDVLNGELQARRQIPTAHPHTQPLGVEFESEERFYSQHDTYRILYVIFSSKPAASSDPDATLQSDTSSDTSLGSDSDASMESDASVELDASVESDASMEWDTLAELNASVESVASVGLDASVEPVASVGLVALVESDAWESFVGSLELNRKRLGMTRSKVTRQKIPSGLTIRFKMLAPNRQLEKYYNLDDTREWVTCPAKKICWIPPGYIGSGNGSHCWAGNVLVMVGDDGLLRMLTFREPLEGQEMGVDSGLS